MSEPENAHAAEETAEDGGAPKKNFKKLILIALVLLLGLGGAGYYFFIHRAAAAEDGDDSDVADATDKKSEKKTKKKPTPAADDEEAAPAAKKPGILKSAIPKDEDVTKVIELPPFIVNLADTENSRYLRMTVSLGVGAEGGESEKPDQLFMTRVRNAMLAVLADKKSEEILTTEGKGILRKELLKAAQAASEEPHVTAIYITDFIVQL